MNLFFYRGLLPVIQKYRRQTKMKLNLKFLRIRRDRHETVTSLTTNHALSPSRVGNYNPYDPAKGRGILHPLENRDAVVLKVSPKTWRQLSVFQRGFWFIDEVEARWEQFLQNQTTALSSSFGNVEIYTYYWSSLSKLESVCRMSAMISFIKTHLFGFQTFNHNQSLTPSKQPEPNIQKKHAGNLQSDKQGQAMVLKADDEYLKRMKMQLNGRVKKQGVMMEIIYSSSQVDVVC
jgi:hypothetical protein